MSIIHPRTRYCSNNIADAGSHITIIVGEWTCVLADREDNTFLINRNTKH